MVATDVASRGIGMILSKLPLPHPFFTLWHHTLPFLSCPDFAVRLRGISNALFLLRASCLR